MKKILSYLRPLAFANEVTDTLQAIFANEAKITTDRWVQLSPYGDHKNSLGVQRFRKEDAITIANAFNSNLYTKLLGLPFYIGHPDHPDFAGKHTDTRAYGRIKELEAREDGLFANVKWNSEGKKIIEEESYGYPSVNWLVRREGNAFRPFELRSVGFTNTPNIPVRPVSAANEQHNTMNPIIPWLKKHGIEIANEATDAQVATALGQLDVRLNTASSDATALANERQAATGLQGQVQTLTAQLANERTTVTNLTGQVTSLTTSLANSRKVHSAFLLDQAITEGRITQADRAAYETEFANSFEAAETKLRACKQGLPIKPGTQLAQTTTQSRDSISKITSMVNERKDKEHISYDEAYRRFKSEKHPLFMTGSAQ